MDLRKLTEGYLKAEGYDVATRGRDLLVGSRRSIGEETEYIYVWLPEIKDGRSFQSQYGPYLNRFKEVTDLQASAKKFMLAPTYEGLSTEFRRDAKQWYNVSVLVPVQFFDTDFTWDESSDFRSAAHDLRQRGEQSRTRRAVQPYRNLKTGEQGDDLLGVLFDRLRMREAAAQRVLVVVGPAGIGKSYLYESLFADLYNAFLGDKRSLQPSRRPFPLLPDYLSSADAPSVRALIRAYLEKDFARPLDTDVFEWMMTNDFAMLLLDGLDEVISRDPAFFDYFLHLMTLPSGQSSPTILLCVRDSLLATNNELRDFCTDWSDYLDTFELDSWQEPSKRQFSRFALGNRAEEFLAVLRSRPTLNDLAATPYYCSLLADRFASGNLRESYTEPQLLGDALAGIVSREYEKGLIDPDVISENEVRAFLEALAAEDMEDGFQGIPVTEARAWARMILPTSLPEPHLDRFVSQMTQLALFSRAGPGQIRFAQENLEHYLLGQDLVRLFENRHEEKSRHAFLRRLSARRVPPDWVTLQVVSEHVRQSHQLDGFLPLVYQAANQPIAFKNLLQIASLAADNPRALRDISFERLELSGLLFRNLDFSGMSFRDTDLSDVEFDHCSLKRAIFEGATISNTAFYAERDELEGADFGDLSRFYSMRVEGGKVVSEHTAAKKWFEERTGLSRKAVQPCPAALQLRHLFGKFVYPNGTARRDWVDMNGIRAGKRFLEAPQKLVEEVLRSGYLVKDEGRERIGRPGGDAYSELVAYVTGLQQSPGIRALLAEVCDTKGCIHAPQI